MINADFSKNVLTIGCSYKQPKGGVAQVIKNYEDYVFSDFKCVVNSGGVSRIAKLFKAVIGYLEMFFRLLLDRKIQIVHIHTASYNSFKRSSCFLRLANAFNKKTVLHIHGGGFKEYYNTNPRWISSMLNKCDTIIVLSESWKSFFESIVDVPKIRILENIVSYPQKENNLWRNCKLHLLFLGKICIEKGIFDLLEMLYEHKIELSGKLVLHIGGNGMVNELTKKIQEFGLSDLVIYEGFVSGKHKNDLLNSCDVFILPSYTEGLPISILESMSYGKPILSTPVGGIPETVRKGENGILFTPGNKEEMFSAISKLLFDEALRKYMGEKSLEIVKSYMPDSVSAKLKKIYEELI